MHRIDSRAHLGDQAAFRFTDLDPAKTALLVIDMQVGFMREGFPLALPSARDIVPNINALSARHRERGGLVVFTRHTIAESGPGLIPAWHHAAASVACMAEHLKAGSVGHAVETGMDVAPGDIVIDKYRYSAMIEHSSVLPALLKERGMDTVIVTGCVTNFCCESTARDAFMMGYRVFFMEDATAAINDEEHNATLTSMARGFADVRSTAEMLALIAQGRAAA